MAGAIRCMAYLAANTIFALAYYAIGTDQLQGGEASTASAPMACLRSALAWAKYDWARS